MLKKSSILIKSKKGKGLPLDFRRLQLKILTPKKMLQRLPIALAQVKEDNTSENLLDEIRKSMCSLRQEKKSKEKRLTILQ